MQFVIIARDGKDEKALERRMAVREAHLAAFREGLGKHIVIGGAMLSEQETMCGSVMVVDFPDRAALDAWLQTDPYVTGNVWQEIEIFPFRLAGKA